MRKIFILIVIFLLSYCAPTPPASSDLDTSNELAFPIGSKTIRTDENNYTYFQLGERYYASYIQTTYSLTQITLIFEVDKVVALGGMGE